MKILILFIVIVSYVLAFSLGNIAHKEDKWEKIWYKNK